MKKKEGLGHMFGSFERKKPLPTNLEEGKDMIGTEDQKHKGKKNKKNPN